MHMADALISPPVGAAFCGISGGMIIYSARKLKEEADEKKMPLMGVLGAFVFAAQMINFTIPGTGSSGHLGGGMILAILLGPHAGFLLALGCNIFNMGFWACFVAYPFVYKRLARKDSAPGRFTIAAVASVMVAMQLGPLSIVIQTVTSGISELPFKAFLLLMQPIHLGIGLIEGLVTAGFIAFVRKARPEILESTTASTPLRQFSIRKVSVGLTLAALLTGGFFSWFASTHPDGLEWSIQKIYGKPDIPGSDQGIIPFLEGVQEKTAILPDYGFRSDEPLSADEKKAGTGKKEDFWPEVSSGKTIAGIVGSMMTLGLAILIGLVFRRRR
jgi:cobalt/nickel transport system permease protein